MASGNRERVGRSLDLLMTGLRPYVEREMRALYGDRWTDQAMASLRGVRLQIYRDSELHWDVQLLLDVIWNNWESAFRKKLAKERNLVSELRAARRDWAHQKPLAGEDTYRMLDSAERLLRAISGSEEAGEVKRLREEVLEEIGPRAKRAAATVSLPVAAARQRDAVRREAPSSSEVKGKYRALHDHLRRMSGDEVTMSFAEVEQVLAGPLPTSARKYTAWWANETDGSHIHARAWMNAGWRARPDLQSERVTFVKSI